MNRSSSSRRSSQGSASSQSRQPQPLEEHEIQSMRSRVIHSGRSVTLPEPEKGHLLSQLNRFGWDGIANMISNRVNEPLIYDFYERLRFYYENDDILKPAIVTNVAGRHIALNRTSLSIYLGVPDEGECVFFKKKNEDFENAIANIDKIIYYRTFAKTNFTGGRMYENNLLNQYRDLNVFLEANILPKAGTNNSVSKFQGFIIYCIATNRKLNLSYIMLKYMGDMIQNKSMGLGYGGILCSIFSGIFGIEVNNNNPTRSRLPISRRTLNLRNTHPFSDRGEEPQQQQYEPQQQHYEPQQQQYEQQEQQQQEEEELQQQQQVYQPPQPVYNPYTQEFSLDQLGEDLNYDLYSNYNYRF